MPFQNVLQPRFIFNLMEYAKLSGAIKNISIELLEAGYSVLTENLYRVVGNKSIPIFDDDFNMISENAHYISEIFDCTPYKDKKFVSVNSAGLNMYYKLKIEFTEEFGLFLSTDDKMDTFGCFGVTHPSEGSIHQYSINDVELGDPIQWENVVGGTYEVGEGASQGRYLYSGFNLNFNPLSGNIDLSDNILSIVIGTLTEREFMLNSFFIGKSFTIDNNPNMNISMTKKREQHTQKTSSGHVLSSASPNKQIGWGSFPRWTLTGTQDIETIIKAFPDIFRVGNRRYDMGYTYISDSSILPENILDAEHGTPYDDNNTHILAESDSFYANMMLLTHNGILPFIFQSNKDEYIPQNFSFCKLEKSPSIRQTAFKSYDIRMQFTECF